MSHPTPDTPETRAALALPTREAAAELGVHPGTVHRLRKRLGVEPPTGAPMPVLVLRVPTELRAALDREATFLRQPVAEVARAWMGTGAFNALTNGDDIHGAAGGWGGFGPAACARPAVRFIGPKHPGWPGVTCNDCRKALGLDER